MALVVGWFGCLAACSAHASQPEDGETALRSGDYQKAIELFSERLEAQEADVRAYRGLIQALRDTGRYGEAEETIQRFERAFPSSVELSNSLGEILHETGQLAAAREAFQRSIDGGASDALTAELNLAVLDYRQGKHPEAMKGFDRFIEVYNLSRRGQLSSDDLTAVGTACRYLGVGNPQLFKDALRALDEAAAADPLNLEPRIRVGELFLEKHNSTDARSTFQEVLAVNPNHPRALTGLAQVMNFDGSPEALSLVQRALAVNPHSVPARVFQARQYLNIEDYEQAGAEAERALEVNPVSLEALSILAAARFLSDDAQGFEETRDRVLALNAVYAELYNTLADVCVQNRLYREAVDFSRQAVLLDEKSWRGYGLLGLNQLRLGDIERGKENLERSFAGDPYNVWIKNTLDLLDTFPNYKETESDRFLLVIDGRESELLAPYVLSVAEEAYDALAERYRYKPATPIRIEVYPSHADFSVRTIGLAGLGALGVCFGPVVAIDSPSAREKGRFNWGSTLWHELAHTVTLGMTDHKVPRWVSEGLSVYEEHQARPGWGDDVGIPFLIAYKKDMLLPIAELNNGFIRPSYPHQIGNSYYQASLVFELIVRDHGFPAILELLDGYKKGRRTDEVFQTVLGVDLETFDESFDTYLKERFAGPLSVVKPPPDDKVMEVLSPQSIRNRIATDPRDFSAQLAMGQNLFKQEKLDEALQYLEQAKLLFPEYGGHDSPYWYLAQIHKRQGNLLQAAEELTTFTRIHESHYEAHLTLAEIRESLGDLPAAAEALGKAIFIYPLEIEPHRRLAELYRQLGEHAAVIRERQAVVALEPVDRAQAIYELARAHYEAGDRSAAKREVLRALEIAPNFDAAQALLLGLLDGTSPTGDETSERRRR
jgi:tetratricopeptide (TPR) repeat protein